MQCNVLKPEIAPFSNPTLAARFRLDFASPVFRMGVQPPASQLLSPRLLTHSTCYQHNNYGKHDSEERRSYDVNQASARTTVS